MASVTRIALLGSTGSIGQQALEVVRAFPHRLRVLGLAAGKNQDLLGRQITEFQPKLVSFEGSLLPPGAREKPPGAREKPPGAYEKTSLEEMASHPEVDLVVVATAGRAGLSPTLAALKVGKRVALANKEVLVMAGEIVMEAARRSGAPIIPIDSEHSALWQCLAGEDLQAVSRLIITASGGPFLRLSGEELARVTPQQALAHPTWRMGKKVTVDAATLMNKGMEVIEAHWLFAVPYEKVQVLIHPQSLAHSLVEFVDGSVKAQLAPPDMRLPIQYALTWPQRWPNTLPRLELEALTFESPDLERFPCLRLAQEAGRAGGTYPAVLAGADEAAVELFLEGHIGFLDIPRLVEEALQKHQGIPHPTLEEVLEAEGWAQAFARHVLSR